MKQKISQIIKDELIPLKITYSNEQTSLDDFRKKVKNIYQLESFVDRNTSLMCDIFFKLNSILISIKYEILTQSNLLQKIENIEKTVGKTNENNIYSLFKFIEKYSTIQFSEDFIFYSCIVETLYRHQSAHGFNKSIYVSLHNSNLYGLLAYDKEKWKRYIAEEKNDNIFFLFCHSWFYPRNWLNSYQNFICLNSRYTRNYLQLKSLEMTKNYKKQLLNSFFNNNFSLDIVIGKTKLEKEENFNYQTWLPKKISNYFLTTLSQEKKNIESTIGDYFIIFRTPKDIENLNQFISNQLSNLSPHNLNSTYEAIINYISKLNYDKMLTIFADAFQHQGLKKNSSYSHKQLEDIFHIALTKDEMTKLYSDIKHLDNSKGSSFIFDFLFQKQRKFSSYEFCSNLYIPCKYTIFSDYRIWDNDKITINHKEFLAKITKEFCKILSNPNITIQKNND